MMFNRKILGRIVKALMNTQGYTHDEALDIHSKLNAITDEEYDELRRALSGKPPNVVNDKIRAFILQRIPELEDGC